MTVEPDWSLVRKLPALAKRARILQGIRAFFLARDFLEVETPQRLPGNAPELHIDAVPSGGWFLQTSPELCMKRLAAAGCERLFQIARVWREGERGGFHLPEFTLLEWYRRGADYQDLMADCEALFTALFPAGRLSWQGREIDLAPPWERLPVAGAFDRHASLPLDEALAAGRFDELLGLEVAPRLGLDRPLLLTEFPIQEAALARACPADPAAAERFELFIAGLELANAFSELTDPREQRRRFERDEAARRAAGKPPCPLPEKFLAALATLPAAAGIALGVDRLVMLAADAATIDEVTAFTPEELG